MNMKKSIYSLRNKTIYRERKKEVSFPTKRDARKELIQKQMDEKNAFFIMGRKFVRQNIPTVAVGGVGGQGGHFY